MSFALPRPYTRGQPLPFQEERLKFFLIETFDLYRHFEPRPMHFHIDLGGKMLARSLKNI